MNRRDDELARSMMSSAVNAGLQYTDPLNAAVAGLAEGLRTMAMAAEYPNDSRSLRELADRIEELP